MESVSDSENVLSQGSGIGDERGYLSERCDNCNESFDYTMDFTIKVPFGVHSSVSTVNDGNIVVENTKGIVNANNVNGSIKLQQLERESRAVTINGDVDVTANR